MERRGWLACVGGWGAHDAGNDTRSRRTLTIQRESDLMSTFSGLRSQWIRSSEWIYASAVRHLGSGGALPRAIAPHRAPQYPGVPQTLLAMHIPLVGSFRSQPRDGKGRQNEPQKAGG